MSHAATLTINLKNLALNYQTCRALSLNASCAAAIKADCYGLGMQEVLPVLWAEGCRIFLFAKTSQSPGNLPLLSGEAAMRSIDGEV